MYVYMLQYIYWVCIACVIEDRIKEIIILILMLFNVSIYTIYNEVIVHMCDLKKKVYSLQYVIMCPKQHQQLK